MRGPRKKIRTPARTWKTQSNSSPSMIPPGPSGCVFLILIIPVLKSWQSGQTCVTKALDRRWLLLHLGDHVIPSTALPVEQVIGIEGNDAPIGMHDMNAGAFHRSHIKVIRIEKLHDHDSKNIFIGKATGHWHQR